MLKRTLAACFFFILASSVQAQQENLKLMREKTEARLREIVGSTRGAMGLAVVDLKSGERFQVNENFLFPQGSAIKIPIMMEVYKQAGEGRLKLTDQIAVDRAHMVGGSGVLQELGDSTSNLSIRDLCVLMIVVSDNTATNILIDKLGMENINRTIKSLGLKETRLQRRMINPAASGRGDENLSTPAEAARIMEILYKGEFLSRAACDEMLAILLKPKTGSVNAALPPDVPVAFKHGDLSGVDTEWAIVYLKERPYIVVVMENYATGEEAVAAMKEISRTLYDYFWRLGNATRYGTYVKPELIK